MTLALEYLPYFILCIYFFSHITYMTKQLYLKSSFIINAVFYLGQYNYIKPKTRKTETQNVFVEKFSRNFHKIGRKIKLYLQNKKKLNYKLRFITLYDVLMYVIRLKVYNND